MEAAGTPTAPPPTAGADGRRAPARRARLQAGAHRAAGAAFTNFAISFTIISVLAGLLHDLPVRVAERRPDRDLDRLAGDLRLRAHGRLLDGRADLQVPDRRRPLLVGARARRPGLELDDRLVQHRRPDRHRRLGRLRRGALPQRAARPLRGRHLRDQLRRRRAHPRRDRSCSSLLILVLYTVAQHLRATGCWRCSTTSRSAGT